MPAKYVVRTYNQVRLIAQPVSDGPDGLIEHHLETEDGTRITSSCVTPVVDAQSQPQTKAA